MKNDGIGPALVFFWCLACACKPAPQPCSADLSLDSLNCGECGSVCAAGSRCEDGRCITSCAGLKCVADICVDPLTDPMNCGACDVICRPEHSAPVCIAGGCSRGPCEQGWFDCDGDPENGCESHDYLCVVEVCGRHDGGRPRSCTAHSVSADGRRVLFASFETDYVPDDIDSNSEDLFLFEVPSRRYRRIFATGLGGRTLDAQLSGDGTRAAVIGSASPQTIVIVDIETGQSFVAPDLPTDAGLLPPIPVGAFSFSHHGQQLARGLAESGAANYGFVHELPAGPTQSVESMFPVQLSGNGQVVGVVRGGGSGVAGEPYTVARDGGTPRLVAKRAVVPGEPSAQTLPPILSFDGTVAAFVTSQSGYEPPEDHAGSATRIVVAGEDGGILRVVLGYIPSLSYDGRRLGYFPYGPDQFFGGCAVIDVVSGELLFASRDVLPSSSFSYCVARVSGDGHWVLISLDDPTVQPFLIPLP